MTIKHLAVRNFRGIRSLDWEIERQVNCLVGPGDSAKTTILDALELSLSPRTSILFADSDFTDCDFSKEISIRVVIADPPSALCKEEKFGLYLVGWDGLVEHDIRELEEDDEPHLAIQLSVASSLEPEWTVVAPNRDPKFISSRDRELIAFSRLGDFVDRHITWARGSALARMGDGKASLREVLAEAQRQAVNAVRDLEGTALHESAEKIEELSKLLGVRPREKFAPGLDARSIGDGTAFLSLHDGDVPLRLCGVGTRRLVTAAIQRQSLREGGAILVDEIEHGLEPHRLIHLIRTLLPKHGEPGPQIFITTHSSTVVAEVGASGVCIVRNTDGQVSVTSIPDSEATVGLVRSQPHAILARKVIVCEGKTEGGLMWALDDARQEANDLCFSILGLVPVDGGGCTHAPNIAIQLASIGFSVAYFCDSDVPPKPGYDEMTSAGVRVFLWPGEVCTEERLFLDVPLESLQSIYDLACQLNDEDACLRQAQGQLSNNFNGEVETWIRAHSDDLLRQGLAQAATPSEQKKAWFKRWDKGKALGRLVLSQREALADPSRETFNALEAWIEGS